MPRAPKYIPVVAAALAPAPARLFTGTSGWAYSTWKPGFYPADVPTRAFLHYYASRFTSVEVNYSFRALPTAEQIESWLDATPPGFQFSFKAPQRITHFQRLRECETLVQELCDALHPVRKQGRLGYILFQLPPNFAVDLPRLKALLCAPALRKRTAPRIAFEFRHASWFDDATYTLLRRHNAALCVAESDELTTPDIVTADFRSYRLRRNGGYTARNLKIFAEKFAQLAAANDTYVYFKHEDEPTGALNAAAMLRCCLRRKASA